MKKNISKILVAVMVFSMMLGIGMVKNAYAYAEQPEPEIDYTCPICEEQFTKAHYQNPFQAMIDHINSFHNGGVTGTSITLENSPLHVEYDALNKTDGTDYFADETTNNWQNGSITEETRVTVDRASYFTITIPKEIVLNGNDGSASYEVSITGELAGDQVLVVKPDATFTLTEDGGKTTPVTVTQTKDTFNYQNINDNEKGNGTLSASGISAGNWSGKFNFNIEFKAN